MCRSAVASNLTAALECFYIEIEHPVGAVDVTKKGQREAWPRPTLPYFCYLAYLRKGIDFPILTRHVSLSVLDDTDEAPAVRI